MWILGFFSVMYFSTSYYYSKFSKTCSTSAQLIGDCVMIVSACDDDIIILAYFVESCLTVGSTSAESS